jgi:hypothetical protein
MPTVAGDAASSVSGQVTRRWQAMDPLPAHRRIRHRRDGVAAVADRAAGRAHDDPPVAAGKREGAGGGDPGADGAGLAVPLPGVEHDGRGRGATGQAGLDGLDPPRPQRPSDSQPGRDGDRRAQRERGQQMPGVRLMPGGLPVTDRGQRERPPRRGV